MVSMRLDQSTLAVRGLIPREAAQQQGATVLHSLCVHTTEPAQQAAERESITI